MTSSHYSSCWFHSSSFSFRRAGPTIRLRRWARKTGSSLIIPNPPLLLHHRGIRKPILRLRFRVPRLPLLPPPRFHPGKGLRRRFSPRCSSLPRPLRRCHPFQHRLNPNCHPLLNRLRHLRLSQLRRRHPNQLQRLHLSQLRLPSQLRRPPRKPLRSRSLLPRLPPHPESHRSLPPRHLFRKALHQPPKRR
jgi:hypothetical protein